MLESIISGGAKKPAPIPVDENVVFLSHFEHSPPIDVVTGVVATWMNTGYYATQPILTDPAGAKFGSGHVRHGGTTSGANEYIRFPKGFTLGTRDFTIESWHLWSEVSRPQGSGQYGWEIGLDDQYYCGLTFTGTRYNSGINLTINRGYNSAVAHNLFVPGLFELPVNEYFHVAVVREGTMLRVYLGGKLAASLDIGTLAIHEGSWVNLAQSNNAYQPWCSLDEMRIVVDQALYSGSTIIVPKGPFPDPIPA
jgi:hypothetical protein